LWICHTNVGALEYDHARILTQRTRLKPSCFTRWAATAT
jgi:hypothetical protein